MVCEKKLSPKNLRIKVGHKALNAFDLAEN